MNTIRPGNKGPKLSRLLIFVEVFFPGWKSGGPTQSIKNIVLLLNQHYDIYVVNRCRDVSSTESYEGVAVDEWGVSTEYGCQVLYLSSLKVSVPFFRSILKEIDPEYIYLNSLWNRGFSMKPVLAAASLGMLSQVVLNPRGELNPGALAFKAHRKSYYMYFFKLMRIHSKITWNATNELEQGAIKANFGDEVKIRLMPNVPRQDQKTFLKKNKQKGVVKLVFLSRITPMKNLEFLLSILPLCNKELIFELDIFGPVREPAYWEECQLLIRALGKNVFVKYKGTVEPPFVLSSLEKSHFFILPTRGENFGHAIFDALCAGLPVLISDRTPWLGLADKEIGWDLDLDDVALWVSTLNRVAKMDSDEYSKLSLEAYKYAGNYKSNKEILGQAQALFSFS